MDQLPDLPCGQFLKQTRLAQGRTIHDIERITKIPTRYLTAIEEQRWNYLPAYVYTSGFVRSYANALQLDPDMLLAMYKRELPLEEPAPVAPPVPQPKRLTLDQRTITILGLVLIAVVLLAVSVIGMSWFINRGQTPTDDLLTPQKQADTQPGTSTQRREPITQPLVSAIPSPTKVLSKPSAVSPTATPIPTSTVAPSPATSSDTQPGLTIRLKALAKVWVLVKIDDRAAYTGFFDKGDDRTWQAVAKISIRIGKPDALKCWINDQEQKLAGGPMNREWRAKK